MATKAKKYTSLNELSLSQVAMGIDRILIELSWIMRAWLSLKWKYCNGGCSVESGGMTIGDVLMDPSMSHKYMVVNRCVMMIMDRHGS